MSNVVHLGQFRQKRNPNVIFVGDSVEWVSEISSKQVGTIRCIYYKECQYDTLLRVSHFHLETKQYYVLDLDDGIQILAKLVTKKVFKK